MMKAIKAALDPSDAQGHVRIVCFMTDGYVGNDMEIIGEVQRHTNARVFAFGIGSSVNRFLLDNMAKYGRGEVEYVALNDDGSAAARRFHERVRSPLLTDISLDWSGLPVADVYPKQIPDLFSAKPVILMGRFTAAASGVAHLKGMMLGRPFTRDIAIEFPESETQDDVLATLWARTRVDDLMGQDYVGAQQGNMKPELKETITQLGLEYRLMTQFTSFVAVEEVIVTDGGQPRRVDVPIEVPEGVNRQAALGPNPSPNGMMMLQFAAGARQRNYSSANSTATQTVTVSSSPAQIDMSSSSVTTVIDKTVMDPGSVAAARRAPSKERTKQASRPSGALSGGSGSGAAVKVEADAPLDPREEARQRLVLKLHPSILAVIDRLNNKDFKLNLDEVKFIRNGNAEIQIWLVDKSDETLVKLAELGFQVVLDPKSAKLVIGRLPIAKLAALAELKAVRYVAPQLTSN
jgi:hypothetical protein